MYTRRASLDESPGRDLCESNESPVRVLCGFDEKFNENTRVLMKVRAEIYAILIKNPMKIRGFDEKSDEDIQILMKI